MPKLLDPLMKSWRWPALALLASLSVLGAAHGFERFALMLPCPLCLRQREVYWAVVATSVTAVILWRIRQNPRFLIAVNVMIGLIFVTGAVVASYHAGVEWDLWPAPSGCLTETVNVMKADLSLIDQRQGVVSCEDAPWIFLGLSMAGWNTLISLGLAALSFRAAGLSLQKSPILGVAE